MHCRLDNFFVKVVIADHWYSLAGNVCMDMTMVNLGDANGPGKDVQAHPSHQSEIPLQPRPLCAATSPCHSASGTLHRCVLHATHCFLSTQSETMRHELDEVGDDAILFGPDGCTASELAFHCDTIHYEILTGLHFPRSYLKVSQTLFVGVQKRVHRVYHDSPASCAKYNARKTHVGHAIASLLHEDQDQLQ